VIGDPVKFNVFEQSSDSSYYVIYEAVGLPEGAEFTQIGMGIYSNIGAFSWIPNENQTGKFTVTFKMYREYKSENTLLDSEDIVITVSLSQHAGFSIPLSFTTKPDETVSFEISYPVGIDPSGHYIDTGVLPPGSEFNKDSREFSWIPNSGQIGSHSIDFYLFENGQSGTSFIDSNSVHIYVISATITDTTMTIWNISKDLNVFYMETTARIVDQYGNEAAGPDEILGIFSDNSCRNMESPKFIQNRGYVYSLKIGSDREGEILSFKSMNIRTGDIHEYNELLTSTNGTLNELILTKKDVVTGIDEKPFAPASFMLHDNYPNPFNPETTISFSLEIPADVNLSIYSVTGSLVKTLVSGHLSAHTYSYIWSGTNNIGLPVSSGVYYYKLHAGNTMIVKRMMLLK
ncbi:FlgD immunoglobulin-like domain containing protein, partial [candidate division KSB1 bacterium]